MEVIIYSFFIVSGAAGISYYAIKKRYARMLEKEQEKAYSAKNNELLLAAEKQKLESVLKEKEHQLANVRTHEESKSISLSGEILSKDKQIQSLSAQLHKETNARTTLEQKLSEKEQREKLLTQQIQHEESRSSSLHNDVTSKEKMIQSLSEELSSESAIRMKIAEELSEKVQAIEILSEQIQQDEIHRASLMTAMTKKGEELESEIEKRTLLEQRVQQFQEELFVTKVV